MILSQLEERLPVLYYASCEDDGAVPLIKSPPGRGKTSVAKCFPRIMSVVDPGGRYGFVEINGSTLMQGTMGGYLQFGPTVTVGGVEKPTSMFSLPWWWWAKGGNVDKAKRLLNEFDGGIICIDEADKVNADENKTLGEAAFAKVWMTHELPPGWVVWFLANRMQDRAGSTKQFSHLVNRQREIEIKDDVRSWVSWAEKKPLMPELITFGEDFSKWLFQAIPDKDLVPWCTPRSLAAADIHLRAIMRVFNMDKIPVDPLTVEEIAGGIGHGATEALMLHIRMGQDLPSYEDVIKSPKNAPVPSKPDGKRVMSYRVADKLLKEDIRPALVYMDRYGEDFQAIFARMIAHKDPDIVLDDAVQDWCTDKAELVAMLERYKKARPTRH